MNAYDKIHLGCGTKYLRGWFHVDVQEWPHVDLVGRVEDLSIIPDNCAEMIYACHVLEHFGRHTYECALIEWHRVLKSGGVLRLSVPDFGAAAKLYMSGSLPRGIEDIRGLVLGGQHDRHDFHGMIFDESSLSEALKQVGFAETRLWDWRTTEHAHMDDYSQAYIPHMEKDIGTLVSLNIEAVKS